MATDIWNLSTLCRCCHADGDFRSLSEPFTFKKNIEIYSQMLKETFLIDLATPPATSSDMICEDCVYLLRSAWRFKKQVEECERKFKVYCLNELNTNFKSEVTSDNECNNMVSVEIHDQWDLKPELDEESQPKLIEFKLEDDKHNVNEIENAKTLSKQIVKSCNGTTKKIVPKEKQIVKKISQTTCVGCEERFSSLADCKHHVDICKLVYKCRYCTNYYSSYVTFTKHVARHITQTEFICNYCNKYFRHKNTLLKHIKVHMGLTHRLQCDLCSTQCNDKTQLRIHKNTVHDNLRPYACDLCNKTFKANKHLKIHYRTHTGEKPYQCDICQDSFICVEYLTVHKRNKHNAPGINKPKKGFIKHVCHVCGKTVASKFVLNRHIETTHFNIKKFACNICGKKFVQKIGLVKHMKNLHNPEKKVTIKVQCTLCKLKVIKLDKHMATHYKRPYACSICFKRYPQKNALNRHMKHVHLLGKPHGCEYCGKTYVKRYSLKMHLEKHHEFKKPKIEVQLFVGKTEVPDVDV